jgi:hypothetical protein
MMTSFLDDRACQRGSAAEARFPEKRALDRAVPSSASWAAAYLRMTFWALRSFAMVGKWPGERRFAQNPVVVRSGNKDEQRSRLLAGRGERGKDPGWCRGRPLNGAEGEAVPINTVWMCCPRTQVLPGNFEGNSGLIAARQPIT